MQEYATPTAPELKVKVKSEADAVKNDITALTQAYITPDAISAMDSIPVSARERRRPNLEKTFSFAGYSHPMSRFKGIEQLLQNNRNWAAAMVREKPDFFANLAAMQTPKILWIGCSDSRVPANQIIGLGPGEVFVHRNVANIVHIADLNCMTVVQYAVDVLKVEHIIVCGHYGCGGVLASMTDQSYGLIDHWIRAIKETYTEHKRELESIVDWKERADSLCEKNVMKSVHNLCSSNVVQSAWQRGQPLNVHGWCYRISDGIIRDLRINIGSCDQISSIYSPKSTGSVEEEADDQLKILILQDERESFAS